ncbi:hypothetical protein K438DRAFT_1802822 [Mycena galopus ATCC 62051]|nr:hypothetical protein K438DRAFT_1802822 [Mycena galopus ATCC 62051]
MPTPPPPEKQKKVSRACNTCRLKRKKCDGLEPCIFCTETGLECSYSREPRRRGPPSGYLRFTETRVALLETLLGLHVLTSGAQTGHILLDAAQRLARESKSHTTQDVWDAYKLNWTDSDASRAIHELAAVFAPFSPAENQSVAARALLPLPQSGQTTQQQTGKQSQQPPSRSPSPFPPAPIALYTNESFERSVMPNDISPIDGRYQQAEEAFELANDRSRTNGQQRSTNLDFNLDGVLSMSVPSLISSPPAGPPPLPSRYPGANSVPPSSLYPVTEDIISSPLFPGAETDPSLSQYPGAYWHTAALASPPPAFASLPPRLSPTLTGLALLSSVSAPPPSADLPPAHVRAALLDTYRITVHPSLPILSSTQCASLSALEASPMLLLAMCAYTARLAPPAVPTRVAADLWYESASVLLSSALRRAVVHPDTVQTLLFLALRDHGRARDALAWRGVGAAVRIAVELGLDGGNSVNESAGETIVDAHDQGLWGVASMLDLFLSIQLGRAPASAEALRPFPLAPLPLSVPRTANVGLPSPASSTVSATSMPPSSTSVTNFHTALATTASQSAADNPNAELAAHTRALVRIVARVHFCVVLGFDLPSSPPAGSDPAHILRGELAAWHRGLPQRFRVALGGERVPREVLEVHMLYQVAAGMLARGSSTPNSDSKSGARNSNSNAGFGVSGLAVNGNTGAGTHAEADDAASTFNVLLDKYRPSLPLAGPPVVWFVFAAARTGLQRASGAAKSSSSAGVGAGTARALQTQLYLLNCREALTSMGGTWELARRCARTLERLMEGEGTQSRPRSGAGKRKRGDGADESAGEGAGVGKRLREEEGEGEGWAEQFDFGVSGPGWGAELDELWGTHTAGTAGLWDTGAWDDGLWGRGVFATGDGSGGGSGLGLGLFDAPPGG